LLTYKNELSIILLRHKLMSQKYILYILISLGVILGWNIFLIQRDNALYDAHYHRQAIENIKRSPNTEIR